MLTIDGLAVGAQEGTALDEVGDKLGLVEGGEVTLGVRVGATDGGPVGTRETDGVAVGLALLGAIDGLTVGQVDGVAVGLADGTAVGTDPPAPAVGRLGTLVGPPEGTDDGAPLGSNDGSSDGTDDGAPLGDAY